MTTTTTTTADVTAFVQQVRALRDTLPETQKSLLDAILIALLGHYTWDTLATWLTTTTTTTTT